MLQIYVDRDGVVIPDGLSVMQISLFNKYLMNTYCIPGSVTRH